jgi:hypothetical protein
VNEEFDINIEPPYLSPSGQLTITIGTTFTYLGQTTWPKVSVTDGRCITQDEDGNAVVETSDELFHRLMETARWAVSTVIYQQKHDQNERAEEDRAARANKQTA